MATLEDERTLREDLFKFLEQLTEIDISSLVRKEELGTQMNFESGLPFFERTLRLYRELSRVDLSTCSYQSLSTLRDRARDTIAKFTQIREFTFAKFPTNSETHRDNFINAIRDSYDNDFSVLSTVIAYGVRSGTDFTRLEREAKQTLSGMQSLLEEEKKRKEETDKTVQQTLDEVRNLAREAGVSQHAELFSEEAKEHATASKHWLTATIWTAFLTGLVAAGFVLVTWFYTPNDISTTRAVQLGISKIAFLSLLFSVPFWAGKMYRSHRHNFVVNRHRLNALRTFETFAKAANDEQTKNAVLIQATQCIFTPLPTGYINSEAEANPMSQILEIVRNVGSKSD
jgi:hypothetical protein